MSFAHFGFGSPANLLALLVVPLLFGLTVLARRRRSRYTVSFTNLATLARVAATRRPRWWRRLPVVLIGLALVLAACALARPHITVSTAVRGATIVLLADVSGSMEATDVRPARIFAAVKAMHDFVDRLPEGDRVGLITFSDKVDVITKPTTDRLAVHSGLDVLTPEGGTALGDGVETAVRVILASLASQGIHRTPGRQLPAAILLESDGAQDRGTIAPFAAAKLAKQAGIRIYGVALGTNHGYVTQGTGLLSRSVHVVPSPATVALLAQETDGAFYTARNADQVDGIYRELGSSVGRQSKQREITSWLEVAAAAVLVAGVGLARARGAALP